MSAYASPVRYRENSQQNPVHSIILRRHIITKASSLDYDNNFWAKERMGERVAILDSALSIYLHLFYEGLTCFLENITEQTMSWSPMSSPDRSGIKLWRRVKQG